MRIYFRDIDGLIKYDIWAVGQPRPRSVMNRIWFVGEVEASGAELQYLKDNFKNLPFSQHPTQSWYGDFAKFIAGNL